MNKNLTAKLVRYEAHLMRQLKATRMELAETSGAPLPIASLPDAD